MNIDDLNGESKWLRAPDLQGKPARVKIADWDLTKFKQQDGSEKTQVVLKFEGKTKQLGLNKTNREMIASMHGKETEDWIGKEITLVTGKTMNPGGQLVDCIRVAYEAPKSRAPQNGNGAPKVKPKMAFDEANPPPVDDVNDEVPF